MHDLTNADLVLRSAQGDQSAFAELIGRYQGSIVALIRRLISNPCEVEDLLQETLVQSWLSIGSVRNPERVHAWLLQVARNRCRDWHKSSSRRECPTDQQDLEDYANRYGRAGSPQRKTADLGEALQSLPDKEHEIVRLFYMQGLAIKDICAETMLPVSTVKSRLFTARHHLRSFFGVTEEKGE